ncbi:spore cortex biosynthesis protein YabQ [Gottschalkia acidurici 9a]|uniref:Spore cortex biosynthesis protein YabQ n=1 Tax=Gottschalkia acidurici (strain ATCC 7906 / DSM 604 / BCRC 14475 / CIP 104303 / KCTC 5404 / NCIMB 10678 / 9a) TaxID=1128398 RepID=K0B3D2_GOTA9|nr:spore cortex biosynthesis protein YabQ [Gottschalkia acidurici]AFS79370.1 spore cortex biosynthesis protein YabQ [Gottschalkia acidurici 9a]
MDTSIQSQSYMFLATLYGGIVMGFIYDLYRIFRYYSRPKKVKTFIEDLIFWIILSAIVISILTHINWGELRGFIFLGFILGAVLYNRLLSKVVIKFISRILSFFITKISSIFKLIITPLKGAISKLQIYYAKIKKYFKLPSIFYDNIKKSVRTILKKK